MNRFVAVLIAAAVLFWSASASAWSGSCGVWAQKTGDYYAKNYSGDQAGYNAAIAYVAGAGLIQIGPGCEGNITIGTVPAGVTVLQARGDRYNVFGTLTNARFGPVSTATTGGAIRIIDGVVFAQNRTGVNAAVQEVIAAGGGLVLMPRGRYRWDQAVTLNNAVGVTIQGVGDSTALYGDYATGDDAFRVTGNSNDITFRDFMYDGDRTTNAAGRGIDVETTTGRRITVDDVTIQSTNDAAIVSNSPVTIVRNCTMRDIGDGISDGMGVLLGGTADSSRVEGNDIRDCKDIGIKVDTNADLVRVAGNRVYDALGGALRFNEAGGKHGAIEGNIFSGSTTAMLSWTGGDSLRIVGNTFTKSRIYSGLYLLRGVSVLIESNIFSFNVHHGLFLGYDQGDCKDVVVTGNLAVGNLGSGIITNPSTTRTFTNITISGNVCLSNGAYGIVTSGASIAGQTYTIGSNVLSGNALGAVSLASTNYTYNGTRFDSNVLVRGQATGKIEFDQAGTNQILASNATGDLTIGVRNATALTIDNLGLSPVNDLILANAKALKLKDTGGTARSVLHTAGGTDILRISPISSGGSIDVLSFAGVANVTFRDDGIFVTKGYTFANLPTASGKNGGIVFCTDCKGPVDAGWSAGMAAASGGTGAMVFGLNGAWRTSP